VLERFPRAVRQRALNELYAEQLQRAYLLRNSVFPEERGFLPALLSLGKVDVYVKGVAVVEAKTRVHDLLILLDGEVRVRASCMRMLMHAQWLLVCGTRTVPLIRRMRAHAHACAVAAPCMRRATPSTVCHAHVAHLRTDACAASGSCG
jgi:hypothetical protein